MSGSYGPGKCPRCNRNAFYMCDYYGVLEYSIDCWFCGYYYSTDAVVDPKSPTHGYKHDVLGHIVRKEVMRGGFGICYLVAKDGTSKVFRFSKPISVRLINRFHKKYIYDEIDQEKSYMTLWDEQRNGLFTVFGKPYCVPVDGRSD